MGGSHPMGGSYPMGGGSHREGPWLCSQAISAWGRRLREVLQRLSPLLDRPRHVIKRQRWQGPLQYSSIPPCTTRGQARSRRAMGVPSISAWGRAAA